MSKAMTYRQLRDGITRNLTEEQLDMHVSIATGGLKDDETEFFELVGMELTTQVESDVLDEGHPVLISNIR